MTADLEMKSMMPILDLDDYREHNRIEFLSDFNEIVNSGPLTNIENDKLMGKLNIYLKDDSEERRILLARNYRLQRRNTEIDLSEINLRFSKLELSKAILCGTCLRIKVERSHHCRQCGKCVLKMDHHCPWLANCIGYRNYKYFLLIEFHGIFGLIFILSSYWEAVVGYNISNSASIGLCFIVSFSYISGLGLFGFLIWLTLINFRLAFTNQTVIENADKERFPSSKSVNVYDVGFQRNLIQVFGRNPFLFLLPFDANYEGKGFMFEKIDDGFV